MAPSKFTLPMLKLTKALVLICPEPPPNDEKLNELLLSEPSMGTPSITHKGSFDPMSGLSLKSLLVNDDTEPVTSRFLMLPYPTDTT